MDCCLARKKTTSYNFRQLHYLLPPSFWVGVSTGRPMSWMASLTSRTLQWTRVSLSWWSSLEAGMISQLCLSLMVFLKSFYLLIMSYPFCFCSPTVCAKPCSLHVPKASRSGTCDCSIEKTWQDPFFICFKDFYRNCQNVFLCGGHWSPSLSFAGRFGRPTEDRTQSWKASQSTWSWPRSVGMGHLWN